MTQQTPELREPLLQTDSSSSQLNYPDLSRGSVPTTPKSQPTPKHQPQRSYTVVETKNDDWGDDPPRRLTRSNTEPIAMSVLDRDESEYSLLPADFERRHSLPLELEKADEPAAEHHRNKSNYQYQYEEVEKRKFERLNFFNSDTEVTHRYWREEKPGGRGTQKWLMCIIIGLGTGLAMFIASYCIDAIAKKKFRMVYETLSGKSKNKFFVAFLQLIGVNALGALVAGLLVVYLAPAAAGSGIPDVKAWLNGTSVPDLLRTNTLLVKLVGVIFAVGGGFIVGKEGPMVHTGAALASGITLGRSKALGIDTGFFYSFRNDNDRRDFISVGAAAGVAAAFGAPIGGMLFALEEVSTFWKPGLTWRAFFAAATAMFILEICLSCSHSSPDAKCGVITRQGFIQFAANTSLGQFNPLEFVGFMVMGVLGGVLGALFNHINVRLCQWRKNTLKKPWHKLVEVIGINLLTSLIIISVPVAGQCDNAAACTTVTKSEHNLCTEFTQNGQFTCNPGQWNPLSTLLLNRSEVVIKTMFMQETQVKLFNFATVFGASVIYFFLAVITYGISIPSGLFVPLILIGSTWGHGFGRVMNEFFTKETLNFGTYSLMGAAAMLGGSTRMTISLTAILVEITNDIYYLLPIMMTIMISKWVGDRWNSAIYESHVTLKNLPYLEAKLPSWIPPYLVAQDVMSKPVVTIPIQCRIRVVWEILQSKLHNHNAFPVVRNDRFVGMIERSTLYTLFKYHEDVFLTDDDLYAVDLKTLTMIPRNTMLDRTHMHTLHAKLEDFGLTEHDLDTKRLNVSSYMTLSPVKVPVQAPITHVYNLFRGLGLRHLVVVGELNEIEGIITGKNLEEQNLDDILHHLNQKWRKDRVFDERIRYLKSAREEDPSFAHVMTKPRLVSSESIQSEVDTMTPGGLTPHDP